MARSILAAFIVLALACSEPVPTQVPTDTPTPTATPVPTPTAMPTQTPTPTSPPAPTPLTLEGEGVVVYPYSTPPPNSIVSRRIVVGTKTEDGCSYRHSGMGGGAGTVIERELAYNPETCESLKETIYIPPDGVQVPTHAPSPTRTPGPAPTVDPGLQAYLDWMADLIGQSITEAEQGGMPELAECLKQLRQAYVQGSTVQETVEERCDPILEVNGWGELDRGP